MARRLVAMKAKFRMEGDRRLYTTKPGAQPMDVTCAPLTACRACKNAGWGVKHHGFTSAPGSTDGGAAQSGARSPSPEQAWW